MIKHSAWLPFMVGATAATLTSATAAAETAEDLRQLSIEELADIEVTTVSKRAEPLSAAPAAIYVITTDDIRRFGATSLPEALRLAPNLQVARIDARSHTISARGFNSTEAGNKLLVLIDGRSVYSPLHSGVLWDAQDVMLDDIERIEVVGGPGGTLWGANAVNGVINIITKPTASTVGGLLSGSYGTIDRDFNARYGVRHNDALAYRFYVKGFERDHSRNPNGTNANDDWNRFQGGFKFDWSGERDKAAIQADFYDGSLGAAPNQLSGQNVALNWTHEFADGSPL
jgi:iron complex outermembrane receptor protein